MSAMLWTALVIVALAIMAVIIQKSDKALTGLRFALAWQA
jgi:hypothetical protein